MSSAILHSLQLGLPREVQPTGEHDLSDKPWTTGFFKQPVSEPAFARVDGIDGDGQADLAVHGGPDKAICVYSFDHYPFWEDELVIEPLPTGAFGENFTVAGLTEEQVCIGDVWQVGDSVVVQVSQPRQPCWKLARCWQRKTLAIEVQENGKTGWYFRVLKEGLVEAGMPLTLSERPHPVWTVARANQVMHHDKHNAVAAAELAALAELSASWKQTLGKRAHSTVSQTSEERRLNG
jgi:MOSC domain-containing protein YiiM